MFVISGFSRTDSSFCSMELFDISHSDHIFNNKWLYKMKTKHTYPIWSKHKEYKFLRVNIWNYWNYNTWVIMGSIKTHAHSCCRSHNTRVNHTVGYRQAEIDDSSFAMWCHFPPVIFTDYQWDSYLYLWYVVETTQDIILQNWRHYFINICWKEIDWTRNYFWFWCKTIFNG